jgi:hypothetical protein
MNGATMLRRVGWAVAVLTTVWGACAVEAPDPVQEQVVSEVVRGPCPDQACGENSPVIDTLGFHELNLMGIVNKEGFWIAPGKGRSQIVKGLASYDLNVVNGFITGSRNNVTMLSGTALKGATIKVQRVGATFTLRIADVRTMHFFLPPLDVVEAYRLEWAREGDDYFVNVCGGVPLLIDEGLGGGGDHGEVPPGYADLMNMTIWEAVVFEGDRIDTTTNTMSKVATVANEKWFNIGCATSTPAKLLLTHHTIHSQAAPLSRAWEQRQAMLRLYVGDYCGKGDKFTVARQKLVWKSLTVNYLYPAWKLEARWTEAGAVCLTNPRMLYPSTPLGSVSFPDIYAALNAANCHPARCSPNLDTADLDGADRMSSNPMP